jgi:hypothetical protein
MGLGRREIDLAENQKGVLPADSRPLQDLSTGYISLFLFDCHSSQGYDSWHLNGIVPIFTRPVKRSPSRGRP